MFNDERINAECGKIYSRGILLAVLITLFYTLSRTITLIMQGNLQTVVTYTEAMILILGIGILLIGTFRFHKNSDERLVYEKHSFYKKAAKVFIIAVYGTYILTIPFTTVEMLGGQGHNHLLILLEVIGYLYLFYTFKNKEINFNYSFIAESGSRYYRQVLLNIGGLFLGLLTPFLFAAAWELILHESLAGALSILLAYISSALGLSVEYFFISLVEKASYNSIEGHRFALGTRIAMIACLVVEFSVSVMQCIYVYLVTGNLQATVNIGEMIAIVSQQKNRIEFLLTVLVGLVVCQILSQIKKETLLYKVCRVKILLLALSALEATLTPIWYRALSEDALRFLANRVDPYLNLVSLAITLTMWVLFVYSLIKELGVSRILWIIPALHIVLVVNIFLASQNMLRAATYCEFTVEMVSFILLTIVMWRYHGFKLEQSEIIDGSQN